MSIEYVKPLDYDEVKEKIEKRIAKALDNHLLYEVVLKVVRDNEGKKITKRIGTKIQSLLPDNRVSYYKEHFYKIIVWTLDVPQSRVAEFNLLSTFMTDGLCSVERFEDMNRWAMLEPGRVKKLLRGLEILASMIEEWNGEIEIMKRIHHIASGYELGYIFDLDVRRS